MYKKLIMCSLFTLSSLTYAYELKDIEGKWYSDGNGAELAKLTEDQKNEKLNNGFKYIPSGYVYIDNSKRFQLAPVGFQPAYGTLEFKSDILTLSPNVGNAVKIVVKFNKGKMIWSYTTGVEQTFSKVK